MWHPDDPQAIPSNPPQGQVANQIFTSFHENLKAHEKQLLSVRKKAARQRRLDDPRLLFRDLKGERAEPVETLVEGPSAVVAEVDEANGSAVLVGETQWCPHDLFLVGQTPVEIHHAEPDCLFGDVRQVKTGDVIQQRKCLGSLPQLFEAFSQEWSKRWVKFDHLLPGRWDGLIQTFPSFDHAPMQLEAISVAEWRRAVKLKPARSAVGPDGVSRADLLRLPDSLVASLIRLYTEAETSGRWPKQMLLGIVSALAKSPSAAHVSHYRPITIYSMAYRVWASLRARQVLRFLQDKVPADLVGGMPHKGASAIWWSLQADIEEAFANEELLVGVSVDVCKAFNALPRVPVLAMAIRAGLPRALVTAWSGALCANTRRFNIRGSLGPEVPSCVGFPEGDAMSVVAMCLTDIALHGFVQRQAPMARMISFVDDWQATGGTTAEVVQAYHAVEQFATLWDLELDALKCTAWATQANARASLRSEGLRVVHAIRDLGGHLSVSLQHTNATAVARMRSMEPIWARMAASPAPYRQKVRALVSAAWPKALHGCTIVSIADKHFQTLRSGANPLLYLSCVEHPSSDPGFVALVNGFKDLRSHGFPARFAQQAAEALRKPRLPSAGPVAVLLGRCHQAAIAWDVESGMFQDMWGTFCPFQVSPQELSIRLSAQWQRGVLQQVSRRKGFEGADQIDPALTRRLRKGLPGDKEAVLRVALGGAFFT